MMDDSQLQAQLKRALLTIKSLHTELDSLRASSADPIAILGMACRFPGQANSPEALWQLLCNQTDAISEVPPERWDVNGVYDPDPTVPGKINTRWGGFVDQVDQFDPAFFGISSAEAGRMDPQQRLLLEVAWEALEDAGQTQSQLAGSQTGVFVGALNYNDDYANQQLADVNRVDSYTGPGSSHSIIPGRLSYMLDLRGPSLAIDTACSSSLVAIHLACQSLRNHESDLALAGGVNLILAPTFTLAASKMLLLAADGRCKAFDARADGIARSEGCGIIVLKRLSEAIADQDRILAVIRGSAINQDGRTNGITAPNGLAQQRVIQQALADAQIAPAEVGYIEAHGTGTRLGDPIEVEALGEIYGSGRAPDRPCVVGSLKANIGHAEAAAGVAGVIKAVLALQHQVIPPQIHLQKLNPQINLKQASLVIPTQMQSWQAGSKRRIAGISAFGWSGTNAHVLIEEAPSPNDPQSPAAPGETEQPYMIPLSARSPDSLVALIRAYQTFISDDSLPQSASLKDVAYTASARRSHHEYRVALFGHTRADFQEQIAMLLAEPEHLAQMEGYHDLAQHRKLVFVFPGQGSQWLGMGRSLLTQSPAFRTAIERCEAAMQPYVDWSLTQLLQDPSESSLWERIDIIQPVLFALQVSLAQLWRSWGVEPDAVIGHSLGEVAAFHIAGALSLEDAARVICQRSQLLRRISGQGTMALVNLSQADTQHALQGYETRLSIAVCNSTRSTVVSGEPQAIEECLARWSKAGIFCRPIKVDVASHSPQVDALCPDLLATLAPLQPHAGTLPIYSTVTTGIVSGAEADATYWARNLRQPVQFANTVKLLRERGHTLFVEISPHPLLLSAIAEEFQDQGQFCRTLPSLRRNEDEQGTLLESLGTLYTSGYPINWQAIYATRGRCVDLPAYPWSHERYWLEEPSPMALPVSRSDARSPLTARSPLVGRRLPTPLKEVVFESEWSIQKLPFLLDHIVYEQVIAPGASHLSLLASAAEELWGIDRYSIEEVFFSRPLLCLPGETRRVQLILTPTDTDTYTTQFYGLRGENEWTLLSSARLRRLSAGTSDTEKGIDLTQLRAPFTERLSYSDYYENLARQGLRVGPTFMWMNDLWRSGNEMLSELIQPECVVADGQLMHAGLIDNCFHIFMAAVLFRDPKSEIFIPLDLKKFHFYRPPSQHMWAYVNLYTNLDQPKELLHGDIRLYDNDGQIIAAVNNLHFKRARRADLLHSAQLKGDDDLRVLEWQPQPLSPSIAESLSHRPHWVILADCADGSDGLSQSITAKLRKQGQPYTVIYPGPTYQSLADGHWQINASDPKDYHSLLQAVLQNSKASAFEIVYLWNLQTAQAQESTAESWSNTQADGCAQVMYLVQALAQMGDTLSARLWLCTQGTQSIGADYPVATINQAALWGLGRAIAQELPNLWGGLIDLDPAASEETLNSFLSEICGPKGQPEQIAFRGNQRYVARLVPLRPAATLQKPFQIHSDYTYLITGGLGGLGLKVADWMAEHGARHLVLIGRSQASASAQVAIEALQQNGIQVTTTQCDVADFSKLAQCLTQIEQTHPPLRGVVHAAGLLDDGLLLHQDPLRLTRVLAPKITGAWNLHVLTADLPLDFFVLFSALSALIGQVGQSNYAAGNAFMDALAHYRKQQGLPALSLNWGPWAEAGLVARMSSEEQSRLTSQGLYGLSTEQAMELFEAALNQDRVQVCAASVNWTLLAQSSSSGQLQRLLGQVASPQSPAPAVPAQSSNLKQQLMAAASEERQALMETHVRDQVRKVLSGRSAAKLNAERPLREMGLDSLMSISLVNNLRQATGHTLPVSLVFEYPTIRTLADYLLDALELKSLITPAPEAVTVAVAPESGSEDLDSFSQDQLAALLDEKLFSIDKLLGEN